MSGPPPQYSGPTIDADIPWSIRRHLQILYSKDANKYQGISLLSDKVNTLKPGSTTTVIEGGTGGGSTLGSVTGVAVNNQSGQTAYATLSGDNNALIVFSDASPIAVTLNTQTPPWSCFVANIGALGSGTVTLTPFSGTINGAGTMDILPTYCALVAFDGADWFAATLPIVPAGFGAISHQFLTAYDGTTGLLSAAQPAFTDISGVATTAQIGAGTPSAGEYVDGGTGAWTALPSGASVISINGQTTNYAAVVGDLGKIIQMNSGSATVVTLPVTFATGFCLWVKNVGAGTCTVAAASGDIDADASIPITQWQAFQFYWDGSAWHQLSQSLSV